MSDFLLEVLAIVVIIIIIVAVTLALIQFKASQRSLRVIRKFIDKYGYDGRDNAEIAKAINKEIHKRTKLGMGYEEFRKIADEATNPYLDPAKISH